jgi:hypothetical protein
MNRIVIIGLSVFFALSTAPKANAQVFDIWGLAEKVFGGGVKAGGSVNFGPLNHQAFWGFCSKNGYRSYYDRDGYVVCSYDEFNRSEMEPQGDIYYYGQICNDYYGNNADIKDDGTCESQS